MDIPWVYNISPALATLLLSMLPVFELRVAIPFAIANFSIPLWQIFIYSIIGSFIPAIFILYFLGPISNYLRKWSLGDRFFTWLFARTRAKFKQKYITWGKLALAFFVAIPLPGTGVWTGSLVAWLFNFNKQEALIYIALGSVLAGLIVVLISVGAFTIFERVL